MGSEEHGQKGHRQEERCFFVAGDMVWGTRAHPDRKEPNETDLSNGVGLDTGCHLVLSHHGLRGRGREH